MARMDWVKLDADWYDDEVIEAAADEAPCVLALWPVLIGMARTASHAESNPSGTISTSESKLAKLLRTPRPKVNKALALLVEGELIEVAGGRLGTLRISLRNFGKWQTARGSSADRMRAKRERASRENTPECDGGVTPSDVSVTASDQKRREEKREERGTNVPLSDSLSVNADRTVPPDVRIVFEYWRTTFSKTNGTRLSAERRAKITTRLKSFTVDQLKTAIDWYSSDPFTLGENDRATRYDDLTTIFRTDAKVDHALSNAVRPPAPQQALSRPDARFAEYDKSSVRIGGDDVR